jgi:hypothetical protein
MTEGSAKLRESENADKMQHERHAGVLQERDR